MKRISLMLVLCLAAVAAFSAVAAGSASATEPLLLLKLTKGEFPATYAITATGEAELQTKNSKIICVETSGSGSFENAHLGLALILFKKCKVVATIDGVKSKVLAILNSKAKKKVKVLSICTIGLCILVASSYLTVKRTQGCLS